MPLRQSGGDKEGTAEKYRPAYRRFLPDGIVADELRHSRRHEQQRDYNKIRNLFEERFMAKTLKRSRSMQCTATVVALRRT